MSLVFWNNTVIDWIISVSVVFISYGLLHVIKKIVKKRLGKAVKRTQSEFDDFIITLISDTKSIFLLIVSVYIGSLFLKLPDQVQQVLRISTIIVILIQAGLWLTKLVTFLVSRRLQKPDDEAEIDALTTNAIGIVAKGLVWSVIVLLVLDNIPGVEVTTLIASLGIGGVAIGLAVQNILGDLFASLSIALDKPFVIGDFIVVGDFWGTVEKIGLKSTRVRSLTGEMLVFGNGDLLTSRIRNYQQMERRRVVFPFGVVYETPYEKLVKIPAIVEEVIRSQDNVSFDRAHFSTYGDFSLNFEVVFYMETSDYKIFMDTQQAINLELFRRFEQEAIVFAYPTQTLYIEK